MKKITPSNPYNPTGSDSTNGIISEIPAWTDKAAEKINRHSQEIKELEEKIGTLEAINKVSEAEKVELKSEIDQLKEKIEVLGDEIKKLTEQSQLIAVVEQPPAYKN